MRTPRAAPQTILPHIRRGEESIYLCLRTCLSAPLICLKSETHVQTLLASRDFLYLIPQAKPNGLRPNTIHHKSRAKMISALGCLYSLQLGTGSQQPDRLIPSPKGSIILRASMVSSVSSSPLTNASTLYLGVTSIVRSCSAACCSRASEKPARLPVDSVRPAACLCPPKRCSHLSQEEIPANRSYPGILRPEPRATPSAHASSTVGRLYSSARRAAAIPKTPRCQSSPQSTMAAGKSPRDFVCVNASWSTRSPTSRLSRLVSSRSALKREASFLFSVIRRRKATPGSSILPAAFSLGARRKATSRACGTPLRPAESASACRPGFFHHPILFSPSRT